MSQGYNHGIAQMLSSLDAGLAPLGVELYPFDTPAFFADITANAAAYGFTNTTQSCFNPNASPLDFTGVLGGCAGYLLLRQCASHDRGACLAGRCVCGRGARARDLGTDACRLGGGGSGASARHAVGNE